MPSHYPLSREEERNLKRIRRKIRNKESAQSSRRRKKEYLDNMEDRVRACTEENSQLHKRIEQLESHNKTLASQLKRLHQIIVSGGFTTRQNQTSTAMMVLLLSTALFLFPGFKDHQGMLSNRVLDFHVLQDNSSVLITHFQMLETNHVWFLAFENKNFNFCDFLLDCAFCLDILQI